MSSRMDKYNSQEVIPTRSSKNRDLYKRVYSVDEFDNLTVPSNAREITLKDLDKEITSRGEYRERRVYSDLGRTNNSVIRKEKVMEEQKKQDQIYDINELLNKAMAEKKKSVTDDDNISSGDYLKRLKLDNRRTNIEQVKEMYENIQEEDREEDESLLQTANLSLEILSDLKGDNDITMVSAPIKDSEMPKVSDEPDFYSSTYKFSKKDFEDKKLDKNVDYELENEGNGKLFLKVLFLVFGILLVVVVAIYLLNYFNRV